MAYIGPNDLLVLQKNGGRVRRVTDGVLQSNAVLDLAVDFASKAWSARHRRASEPPYHPGRLSV